LRVGVAIADGVSIVDPEKAALEDHQVRVAVKVQERRNFAEPLADTAVVEDAAIGRQIIGKQELHVGKPRGKQQLPPGRSDRNAPIACIAGENIVLSGGWLNSFTFRLYIDGGVRHFTEVDFRAIHVQRRDRGSRRDVFDEQTGRPSPVALATGPTVSPKPCVKVRRSLIQLRFGRLAANNSGGEHDLLHLAVDAIAVVVHGLELVVGPNLLNLPKGIEQRLLIPQANVLMVR